MNPLRVVAPILEVLTDAEGADYLADAVFQSCNGFPVEMVPVVVGDDEVIDFWNIIDGIDISPFERAHEPPHGQSVGQHGVVLPSPYIAITIVPLGYSWQFVSFSAFSVI